MFTRRPSPRWRGDKEDVKQLSGFDMANYSSKLLNFDVRQLKWSTFITLPEKNDLFMMHFCSTSNQNGCRCYGVASKEKRAEMQATQPMPSAALWSDTLARTTSKLFALEKGRSIKSVASVKEQGVP
ncbi:hypothetical protein VNO78_22621 [Psophocarpus tetragonolobus]|uniref:Uncharacterized protein n=1 Tax=Psophocarpus tetragonolobus TaxID=3891 RepID=A0AAN9S2A2_PSOTE